MPGWEQLYTISEWPASEEYTDLCDIYPHTPGLIRGGHSAHPSTPQYSGVPCKFKRTFDLEQQTSDGQQTVSNFLTQDFWTMHSSQPLKTNDGIVMRTPGHPEFGYWWVVQGDPKANPSSVAWEELNEKVAYSKELTAPANVPTTNGRVNQ